MEALILIDGEGDTLMVDTVGLNDLGSITVLRASGSRPQFPQTETLHVIERFRRSDLGHLEVVRTFDDPGAFKHPFTTHEVHSLAPKNVDVLEYVCNENEKDAAHRHF